MSIRPILMFTVVTMTKGGLPIWCVITAMKVVLSELKKNEKLYLAKSLWFSESQRTT